MEYVGVLGGVKSVDCEICSLQQVAKCTQLFLGVHGIVNINIQNGVI